MKKTFYLFAGALLLLMGCAKIQNEEAVSENGKRTVSLNASIDDSDTRISVTINGEEARYSWQEGDAILVMTVYDDMYGSTEATVTSGSIGQDGATARFDVDLDEGYELGKYAFYPANWQCWDFDDHLEFGLSDYYFYEEGVTNMPMLGTITSTGARFRAVGGLLKVTIENIPTSACRLQFSVPGKKITGSFTVTGSPKQITTRDMDEEYNEMDGECIDFWFGGEGIGGGDFPGGGEGPEGGEGGTIGLRSPMTFYIPLPCGKYNNLTFSIFGEDSDEPLFTRIARMDNNHDGIFSDEEGIDIHRNEIVVAPTLGFVMDQNLPQAIFLDMEQYEDDLDENGVLHVDQYDDEIGFVASIKGKYSRALDEFDADLISCQLVNVTDPENIVRTPITFEYVGDYDFNVSIPTDVAGEFKLEISYGALTPVESFNVKVYPVVPIPAALGEYWEYRYNYYPSVYINSSWFEPYWNKDGDGNVYLKTRLASARSEALPDYAFRGSFTTENKGGSFDAFEYFSQIEAIPTNAFYGCSYLTGINLPSSVTSIGTSAFNSCQGLTGLDLPSGLTSIGNSAFSGCYNLSSMQLPSGVTSIGGSTFSGCWELTSINLDNVLSIGAIAFSGCESLTGPLQIGGATIGDNAFNSCTALQGVTIGSSTAAGQVPMIGAGAFSGCASLSAVNLPNSMVSIGDEAFYNCGQLTNIVLPSSLETIGIFAFNSTGLTSLTIPASVTSIGRGAFRGCAFEYVIMEGENPADIGEAATDPDEWWIIFDAGVTIYVPSTAVAAYQAAWPVLASRIKGVSELTASN